MQKVIKNIACSVVWLFYISTTSGVECTPCPYVSGSIGTGLFSKGFVQKSPYLSASPKSKIYYDLGVGYKLNASLRIDINGQRRKFHYSATEPPITLSQTIENYSAFLNVYYSIPTETGFSVYFTVGVGMAYNKPDPLIIKTGRLGATRTQEATTTNFAYNIGGGVTMSLVDLHPGLDLVLTYSHANLGKLKVDGTSRYVPSTQTLKAYEIGAGLIFNL